MSDAGRAAWARHLEADALRPAPPRVVHTFMAMGFLTKGEAVMAQSGGQFLVRAGELFLVPAGARHGLVSARGVRAWGVGFEPAARSLGEFAPLMAPFERAAAGASAVVRVPAERHDHLARLCAELERESRRTERGAVELVAARSLLGLILTEVARASAVGSAWSAGDPPRPGADGSALVREALRFIEQRCLEPISLRDVAAAVGRSPSHVATAVKAATGTTVGGWIRAGRLAEARTLLRHTDERVEVIAERVGYADPTHFIRTFRRAHGATPAGYRAGGRAAG